MPVYLESFTLPSADTEEAIMEKRKYYNGGVYGYLDSAYPCGMFPDMGLSEIRFRNVTVFYGGSLIAAQTGTNPFSATFPADEPSNHGGDNIEEQLNPVMTFVIPDHGQKKTKSFEPKPLSESAMEKMSMR